MSLLNQPFAVPSRVKGAAQFVVRERGQRVKRESAEALLSPLSLRGEEGERDNRAMVRRTLDECVRLRLFLEDGDFLLLNPSLPVSARNPDTIAVALPGVLLDLILDVTNPENQSLAAAIAWFLSQDALDAPSTWDEFGIALREQDALGSLEFNDTRYANFAYWVRYLGLANMLVSPNAGGAGEIRLLPDPTACVRRILNDLFTGETSLGATDFLRRLGARCSVFEGGVVRNAIEHQAPGRESKHLSSTTSLALLRLEEEESLRMLMHSDADKVILVDGHTPRDVSQFVWVQSVAKEAPDGI